MIDVMVDIYGEVVREEFMGKWKRKCWLLDEFLNGGWVLFVVGNYEIYLLLFFEMYSYVSIFCVVCLFLEGEMIDVWIDDFCGRVYILYICVDCFSY